MIESSQKETLYIRCRRMQRAQPLLGSMEISFSDLDTSIGDRWRQNPIHILGNLAEWHKCRCAAGQSAS